MPEARTLREPAIPQIVEAHRPRNRVIIDLNSLLNAALLGGKDPDAVTHVDDGKLIAANSAAWGVERFFSDLKDILRHLGAAPVDVIGVWDGEGAKAKRQAWLPGYKAGREKSEAVFAQLQEARGTVTATLRALGVTQVVQKGFEADDVIAWLTTSLRHSRNTVVSRDGDLCALVGENTDVLKVGQFGDYTLNANPFGPFPHRLTGVYKALVGDPSDRIPGATGFGDTAFLKLLAKFGVEGLEMMQGLLETAQLHRLEEDVAELPALRKVIDCADQVYASWRCAKLYPEQVNAHPRYVTWLTGMVRQADDPALQPARELSDFFGTKTLVHAGNERRAIEAFERQLTLSPFVALDIETATPPESDEWLENVNATVDVLASRITGMSLTFGQNMQHTVYIAVNHSGGDGVGNVSTDTARRWVEAIPQTLPIVIQNRDFEFSVLYQLWGQDWKGNSWGGFAPNALDTKIEASYVDENESKGLKQRSSLHLDYQQQTYKEVTTIGGVQHKMDALPATHVFDYGCDDTICTAALHVWYRIVMEIERTWDTYILVEQLPQYLTSLAFVQGCRFSPRAMREMEDEDRAGYDVAWARFSRFLKDRQWPGTVPETIDDALPGTVKLVVAQVLGDTPEGSPWSTRKRKPDGMAQDIREAWPDDARAAALADAVESQNVQALSQAYTQAFTGEPDINFSSPKQIQRLLYGFIGATPRLYNDLTDRERGNVKMREAFYALKDFLAGKLRREPRESEREIWASKAKTDDDAVALALANDDLPQDARQALVDYARMKQYTTRKSLFYTPYKVLPHWQTRRLHSSMNQCEAVTRRYSSSGPNLQQLPSRGEGVRFRSVILPHKNDAIIVSCDFNGQELRLMAEQSQDESMVSCYVGDNKRDIHSLIAVEASPMLWKVRVEYVDFMAMRKSADPEVKARADALRSDAKTVNFASAYDAQAPKISIELKSSLGVAEQFLEAKSKAFPGLDEWKEAVRRTTRQRGYAVTMLGARRHLAKSFGRDADKWEQERAGRQAPNFHIQGSGAEMVKLAMARMWQRGLFTGKYDAQFIAPVHDECVASVHRDQAVGFIREFHWCMTQQYADMGIELVSEVSIGRDFRCPVEVKSLDPQSLREAVDSLFEGEAT